MCIKKIMLLMVILLTIHQANIYAQGQFAGARTKGLIGKKYTNDRVLPGLPDYKYMEASLASDLDDPEQFTIAVYYKGPTYIVVYSINEDTTNDEYTILDVLVIKQVKKNQVVKTLLCRENKINNMEIVAIIQPGNSEYYPALRAWRFNRDKRRFQLMNIKGIDCLQEGDD